MLTTKKYLIIDGEHIRIVNNPEENKLYEEGAFILARLQKNAYRILSPKRFRHLGLTVSSKDSIEFVSIDDLIFV